MEHILKFFKDKHGKIAIWLTPNLTLILWVVATILAKLISHGRWHSLFDIVAFGTLFAWAWGEIWAGLSPFRRLLGAVVLIFTVMGRVR